MSYHLRLLRDEGLVTARRSSFDGRDSYYHLDLARCADALAETGERLARGAASRWWRIDGQRKRSTTAPAAVLFVCTGNSIRSPIAEALLRRYAADRVTVTSAEPDPVRTFTPRWCESWVISTASTLPAAFHGTSAPSPAVVSTMWSPCATGHERPAPISLTTRGGRIGAFLTRRGRGERPSTPRSSGLLQTSRPVSDTSFPCSRPSDEEVPP